MPDRCGHCGTPRPVGGTESVLIKGVRMETIWVEFCEPCGDKWVFTNGVTGESMTARELKDGATEVTRDADDVDELLRQVYGDSA